MSSLMFIWNNMKNLLFLALILSMLACSNQQEKAKDNFIRVENGKFILAGEDYHFKGANYWQGMNLGAKESGDRKRLLNDLDKMQEMGITNLRILASSEGDEDMKYSVHPALQSAPGVYNDDVFGGLDFLLSEMAKRDMKAVMVLGNFWTWSGGFTQYLKWSGQGEIPYPQDVEYSWQNFTDYSKQFYFNDKAQKMMENHISTIVSRKNYVNGVLYSEDATIMSWQLSNEPRGYDVPEQYRKWTKKTASYIKSLNIKQLISLGTEGNTPGKNAGVNALLDNDNTDIDYITMHIWAQNWGWFAPGDGDEKYNETIAKVDAYWNDHVAVAKKLNKPIVLEEFGLARDESSYLPSSSTVSRDKYFNYIFSKVRESVKEEDAVRGFNFWSYTGEARPPRPGEFWKKGDVLLGDPPHELQGWYGVYDKDTSTINLVSRFKF